MREVLCFTFIRDKKMRKTLTVKQRNGWKWSNHIIPLDIHFVIKLLRKRLRIANFFRDGRMTKVTTKTKAVLVKMNPIEHAMVKRLSASKGITMAELVRQLLWEHYQRYYQSLFMPVYDPKIKELEELSLEI